MKKYNLAIIGLGVGEKVLKSLKNHKRIKKIKIFDFNKNKLKTCEKNIQLRHIQPNMKYTTIKI